MMESFHRVVERIRNQKDVDESELFELLAGVAGDIESNPDLWLERVFQYELDSYRENMILEHSLNVGILSMSLGVEIEIPSRDLLILGAGALLHDIGMFEVPNELVQLPRSLTERERKMVEMHPTVGRKLLEESPLDPIYARIAYQEQERRDGTGYPQKLKGSELDTFASIIGFCDTIESITHYRPHRKPSSFYVGFQQLLKNGREGFPKDLWLAAIRRITPYPPGSLVKLSNGKTARVLKTESGRPLKPVVEVVGEIMGSRRSNVLDLARMPMVYIVEQGEVGTSQEEGNGHIRHTNHKPGEG